MKDEFDAFLECGSLAHGFLLRCGDCGHDKLAALSCKRRGFCPSCGARRVAQTTAHLVDHVIPHVPVHRWVLSLPIPLRLLLAAQPQLLTRSTGSACTPPCGAAPKIAWRWNNCAATSPARRWPTSACNATLLDRCWAT